MQSWVRWLVCWRVHEPGVPQQVVARCEPRREADPPRPVPCAARHLGAVRRVLQVAQDAAGHRRERAAGPVVLPHEPGPGHGSTGPRGSAGARPRASLDLTTFMVCTGSDTAHVDPLQRSLPALLRSFPQGCLRVFMLYRRLVSTRPVRRRSSPRQCSPRRPAPRRRRWAAATCRAALRPQVWAARPRPHPVPITASRPPSLRRDRFRPEQPASDTPPPSPVLTARHSAAGARLPPAGSLVSEGAAEVPAPAMQRPTL